MAHFHGGKDKTAGTHLPDGGHHWLTAIKQELHLNGHYELTYDNDAVHIQSNARPEFNFTHPIKEFHGKRPDPSVIGEVTVKLSQFHAATQSYLALMKELEEQMGFTLDRGHKPPRLANAEFGITVDLKGDAFAILPLVRGAKELYEEKWFEREERESASPKGPPGAPPPGGHTPPKPARVALPFELPEREKVVLVLDSCLMGMLAEPRAHVGDDTNFKPSRTWLEMLDKTAGLPNVTMVVPSLIADWELQGKTAVFRPDGKSVKVKQVDDQGEDNEHTNKRYCYKVFNHFFKDASRARLGPDGHIQMLEGKNKNLIIWESPHDRELHTRINNIIGDKSLSWSQAWKQIDNDVRHHDEGEKCIEAFLQETPYNSPVIVLSQDHRWFDSRKHIQSTHAGLPAGEANFGAYVGAELKVREAEHLNAMREPGPLNLDMMMYRINDHRIARGKGLHSVTPHSKNGAYAPGVFAVRAPESIEEVIQRGVELEHGKYRQYLPEEDSVLAFLSALPWRKDHGAWMIGETQLKEAVANHFPTVHAEQAMQRARHYMETRHTHDGDAYCAATALHVRQHGDVLFKNILTDRLDAQAAPVAAKPARARPAELRALAASEAVAASPVWDVRRSPHGIEVFAPLERMGEALPQFPAQAVAALGGQCHAVTREGEREIVADPALARHILDRQRRLFDKSNGLLLDALDRSILPDGTIKHFAAQITTTSGRNPRDWAARAQQAQHEPPRPYDNGKY